MKNIKITDKIKLIASDFDGVFTDGTVFIDENLNFQKKVSFKDIMGVSMALKAGIDFAIISGENSNILDYFKNKFNVKEIHKGIREKGKVLKDIMERYNLKEEEVIYLGDDINDISAFELVKYKIAPPNANPFVKGLDGIQITNATGGDGVFREVVDIVLGKCEPPKENSTIKLDLWKRKNF